MPITIQANKMQVRNNQGDYVNIDAVSDATTASRVAIINDAAANGIAEAAAAAQTAVGNITTAAQNATELITNTVPLEYSQLSNNVKLLNNENKYTAALNYIFLATFLFIQKETDKKSGSKLLGENQA